MLEKTYDPTTLEQFWYQEWEKKNYFAPRGGDESYCIMLPPPNVTGSLHMGHGFGYTLMDILIRYHRMRGFNTLWQAGTDHAGIATQMVVERRLKTEGKSRHDLGREQFIDKIWEWKEESGGNITKQLRRLGASLDWQRERFTLDEDLSYAVREVFIRLYNEGLIYRGKRLVNWDPVLLTAISDLEVINEETEGKLWYIRYPLANQSGHLIVATTRPETMFGDQAIAVHPDDERYRHLIGQEVHLPLANRTIPIIADDYVDPEFGTGCVKITPAHDFNDYAIGVRHQLDPLNILTPQATLNENAPSAYQGLDRFDARAKALSDLEAANLIEKIEKHTLKVPKGDRSGAVVEPYLTYQWYVKASVLAKDAITAVENGTIQFVPENWNKTYFQWMHNIEDWCISRQLWWGHRIPVWYDDKGKAYAGHNEEDIRTRYQLSETIKLTHDEDVLDTWFSSALWPFTTLGWPSETKEYQTFFPTTVLVTAFDIIFFWVARMIMMSLKFTGKIPFKDVYITGLIRDAEGQKMSKSKGNVLDPIDLIDGIDLEALLAKRTYGLMQPEMAKKIANATRKEFPHGIPGYGTDALRMTFCSLASYTREIRFDIGRLGGYRNFCNKLWNAARYVLMNTEDFRLDAQKKIQLGVADAWVISKLQNVIVESHEHLAKYRFDLLAQTLYDFTWNEFCDWYVELSKTTLNATDQVARSATQWTLLSTLETLLRLLHPIMPFITEEIWQKIAPKLQMDDKSIMVASYPEADAQAIDQKCVAQIEWMKAFIIEIRTIRAEKNVPPGRKIHVNLAKGTTADKDNIRDLMHFIQPLIKVEALEWVMNPPENAIAAFLGALEIFVPLKGLIDVKEETNRLQAELTKLQQEMAQIEKKLNNPQFVERAPTAVVEKEKNRLEEARMKASKLEQQLAQLKKM